MHFNDSHFKTILFATKAGVQCVEKLEVKNTNYDSFQLNWKKIKPADMAGYCGDVVTE